MVLAIIDKFIQILSSWIQFLLPHFQLGCLLAVGCIVYLVLRKRCLLKVVVGMLFCVFLVMEWKLLPQALEKGLARVHAGHILCDTSEKETAPFAILALLHPPTLYLSPNTGIVLVGLSLATLGTLSLS